MATGVHVLAIDTAGPVVGVAALGADGRVVSWQERVIRGADTALLPAVGRTLAELDQVDLVAVSNGPGAFTGLRVGVATALGVAVARGVPVVGLSSLEARAMLVRHPRVFALLDARKGRVYAGLYDTREAAPVCLRADVDEAPAKVLDAVADRVDGGFVAVGEGAVVYRSLVESRGGRVAPEAARCPVDQVARLGAARRRAGVDAAELGLRYLRPPDARRPSDLLAPGESS